MEKERNIWKLTKSILSSCDDKNDIPSIVETLRDDDTRKELIKTLLAVKNLMSSTSIPKNKKGSNLVSIKNKIETVNKNSEVFSLNNNQYTPEAMLCGLFRDKLKMTNRDVEEWLNKSLGLRKNSAKSSLCEYLKNILKPDPVTIGKDIVSQVYLEFKQKLGVNADLWMFWDRLDAREKNDKNPDIQNRINKISSNPTEL